MRNFSSISKRDQEEFGGIKGVIRIRKSKDKKTQWPKEKGQKDKQRSTKHTHKTEDRVTRTLLKTGSKLGCSGRVGSSCSTRYFYSWIFIVLYIAHWNTVHRIKKDCDSTDTLTWLQAKQSLLLVRNTLDS